MITRKEIEAKGEELEVHAANVQQDYVFGWILAGIYRHGALGERLVLKGGNCLRKAYFENARFSGDLDFAIEEGIDAADLHAHLNQVCEQVQAATGVQFETDRNRVREKTRVDRDLRVWEARLYFRDFYGESDHITISVRLDVSQFERFWLPIQSRALIHPYSDSGGCNVTVRCMKLEEVLASKLKCLIQRRHVADLYDYVYYLFFKDHDVDVSEVLQVFLKKTIYQRAPRVARALLVNLPFSALGLLWERFIVSPGSTNVSFDSAKDRFLEHLDVLFAGFGQSAFEHLAFFPARLRTPIMDAGASQTLLQMRYHGAVRLVEPYSLVYRVRQDGVGREYFYGYDRTGGRTSGPGLKTFVASDIQDIAVTEEAFEPRFEVEVSKAGEFGDKLRFSSGSRGSRAPWSTRSRGRRRGIVYVVECASCGKAFSRIKYSTRLRRHQDRSGFPCGGRHGVLSRTDYR